MAEYVAQELEMERPAPSRAQQQAQAQQISSQQAALRAELERIGAEVLSSLRVGANGFHVRVRVGDIPQLLQLAGVTDVAHVTYHVPVYEPWLRLR